MSAPIPIARNDQPIFLFPSMANRHGLIAGATGTGKTVTLRVLAESFSQLGVPVFLADMKGDLASLSQSSGPNPKMEERSARLGFPPIDYAAFPVIFWDVFGTQGHPIRTTITEMGPLLLSRLLDLNEIQASVLQIVFRVADEEGLLLLDLKDLRAMLQYVGENTKTLKDRFGHIAPASLGAIQRSLLALESEGGGQFFGEPALEISDLMRTAPDGRGFINILAAERLLQSPKTYATLLLWLLSELFEELPEVGDAEQPKLVFFFDEAHLLFRELPKEIRQKIEQVVRLIRSKGVGVYFVTQSPLDVPDEVLGQLGNRVQHALRAFTPRDQKAVRAAAETFRTNPALDTVTAITDLAVGEALVSTLETNGQPGIVQRAFLAPPRSRLGTITPEERQALLQNSPVGHRYDKPHDRHSAYEELKAKASRELEGIQVPRPESGKATTTPRPATPSPRPRGDSPGTALLKSTLRSLGNTLGREIMRGVLGSLTRRRR